MEIPNQQLWKLKKADRVTIVQLFWLMEQDAANLTARQLIMARENAGLSVGQAARLMGIERETLATFEFEFPDLKPIPELAALMNECYGLNQKS